MVPPGGVPEDDREESALTAGAPAAVAIVGDSSTGQPFVQVIGDLASLDGAGTGCHRGRRCPSSRGPTPRPGRPRPARTRGRSARRWARRAADVERRSGALGAPPARGGRATWSRARRATATPVAVRRRVDARRPLAGVRALWSGGLKEDAMADRDERHVRVALRSFGATPPRPRGWSARWPSTRATPDGEVLSASPQLGSPRAATGAHHHGPQETILYVIEGRARTGATAWSTRPRPARGILASSPHRPPGDQRVGRGADRRGSRLGPRPVVVNPPEPDPIARPSEGRPDAHPDREEDR